MSGSAKLFPNAGQAVLLMVGSLTLQVIFGALAALAALVWFGKDAIAGFVFNPWLLAAGNTLAIYVAVKAGLRATREPFPRFAAVGRFPTAALGPIAVTSLGLGLVLNATDNVILDLLRRLPGFSEPDFLKLAEYPLGGFVLVVLVAPLTEEYLYRGLILRGLLTSQRPWTAILLSAALFALMHANIRQLFLAFVLGVVFGWWYWRTRSVGPGLIGHALFNSLACAAAHWPELLGPLGINSSGHATVQEPWWLTAGGAAFSALGLAWFALTVPPSSPAGVTPPADPPLIEPVLPPLLEPPLTAQAPAESPPQRPAASPAS